MKRTNVIVDEELLENARRVLGERTYSGAITKALEEIIRRDKFGRLLEEFQAAARRGEAFRPEYLEEIRPNAYALDSRRRLSAKSASGKQKRARSAR